MKSRFFIGHRDAPDTVLVHLTITLERLIVEENVGYFFVGRMDALTAWLLLQLNS